MYGLIVEQCVGTDIPKMLAQHNNNSQHVRVAMPVVSPVSQFLANVNSRSLSLYIIICPSVVCRLSVTFVHPTQATEIFGNVSMLFGHMATC